MKILFVINSLHVGGAERVLLNTAEKLISDGYNIEILTLFNSNELLFEYQGISRYVKIIEWSRPKKIYDYINFLRKNKPEVICSVLYYSDFLGSLLSILIGCKKNIWWIHNLNVNFSIGICSYIVARLNSVISNFFPYLIIYCSESAMAAHLQIGYSNKNGIVINNALDFSKFIYSKELRLSYRTALGYSKYDVVVGFFCRWDPCKNYTGFLNSMAKVNLKRPIKVLLIGSGINDENKDFIKLLNSKKKSLQIIYLDNVTNLNPYYSAIDIFVQFSFSESFGLCLCEAIAAECFSISSNVGIANMVLSNEFIVEAGDEVQLEKKIIWAIETGIYKSNNIKKIHKITLEKMIRNDNSYEKLCQILN